MSRVARVSRAGTTVSQPAQRRGAMSLRRMPARQQTVQVLDSGAAVMMKRMAESRLQKAEAMHRPPPAQEGKICGVWPCSTDITVARAKGCQLWAADGRGPFLDLTAGIAVVNTGHCHPKVTRAIQEQAELIIHAQINNYHHPGIHDLARRLGGYLPLGINTIYYDNTGTQAIEAAIKLARLYTKRPNILTLHGGMHGRSTMCSSLTSNASIRNPPYTPMPSGVYTSAFPAAYRWGVTEDEAVERALSSMRDILKGSVRPDQVAAIIFEPVLGEGGFYPIPPRFAGELRKMLQPHGILYISDEIQAGYGRTGKMWGCEHFADEWTPDIIACSKGIASGMPLSVVASTEEIMSAFTPGQHGGTFNGNAVAVAAALATLDVFEEEGLIENSRKQGAIMKDILSCAWEKYQPAGQVRGHGLMLAVECRTASGQPDPECARYIKEHCRKHQNVLIYAPTGFDGNILRLMPPLVLSEAEMFHAASAIEGALKDWSAVANKTGTPLRA